MGLKPLNPLNYQTPEPLEPKQTFVCLNAALFSSAGGTSFEVLVSSVFSSFGVIDEGMVRVSVRVRVTTARHLHRAARAMFVFADMIQTLG